MRCIHRHATEPNDGPLDRLADRLADRQPARAGSRSLAALLAALVLGPATIAQAPGTAHDPNEGIDPDGRITRPEMAADLPHPERWRYIPEGRIVPGSVIERLFVTSFVAPQVFAEPDIGVGGGLVMTDIDFRNQRRQEFAGIFLSYTTEGQQSYRIVWRRFTNHLEVPGGGVLQDERSYWRGAAGYQRTLTRRFYGLGADTSPSDETSYTDEVTSGSFGRDWTLDGPAGDWIAGVGALGEFHNLASGRVEGVPTTGDAHPDLFAAGDGQALGWIGASLEWNTRDSLHSPLQGTSISGGVSVAPLQTGGDIGGRASLGFSQVLQLPSPFHDGGDPDEESPPIDTLAIGGFTSTTFGDLPFYALPSLGGANTLRGYINNRFTDRSAWHASAEYRFWFAPRGFPITRRIRVEKLGAALFYDVGSVADDWTDLGSSTVRDSLGFGLRFHLERLALFRIDFGFSAEDRNLHISYGLPF